MRLPTAAGLCRAAIEIIAMVSILCVFVPVASAQSRVPARSGPVDIKSITVKGKNGDVVQYEGDVELTYEGKRLRCDFLDYDTQTGIATARGHVQFDYNNEHVEADDATYNVNTGSGVFHHVHGAIMVQHRPNAEVLITPNPLSFEAAELDRLDERTYKVRDSHFTVCDPNKPTWMFYAPHATIHMDEKVALLYANFRLFRIPLMWLPYMTTPASQNVRQSGFLLPLTGQSSVKGFVFGDGYYWAPTQWFDNSAFGELMSRRGWSLRDEVRARPWENVNLTASYFGVVDRGLPGPDGIRVPQGGHEIKVQFDAQLANGWRAVADVDQLSSLTFRLAFAETFGEAVNAEANTTGFLSNNFHGFSVNFGFLQDRDFLTAQPQTLVSLRAAPQVSIGSVEQAPWAKLPIYLSFDASIAGMYRSDPNFTTPSMVQRSEVTPRITIPLHWGAWLGLTATAAVNVTRYGAQVQEGGILGNSFVNTAGEFSLDVRLPSLERTWDHGDSKWKHSIEPLIVYNYVTGVNDFGRIIRFDSDDTLTDTNEVEYGLINRLYHRAKNGSTQEIVTWRLVQKYYFDPTFGGAIVPGQRNVFEALDSISPFAFADGPRRISPLVSDVLVTPGGRYDFESRIEYDTQRHRLTTVGTLFKVHPWEKLAVTFAYFDVNENPVILQPRADQIRALVGFGDQSKQGWNATAGVSYDIQQHFLQTQIAQIGYNGTCCGLQFEYRRIALPTIREENQFRVALVIANLGSFGNIKRTDKIY
ncbi:MAG TPA: LPS assembly protein LptD [Candidatus Acidoferrum sp.]|nr:LPS assembly protein LptD [Candidatus Acidoferrum sp.]